MTRTLSTATLPRTRATPTAATAPPRPSTTGAASLATVNSPRLGMGEYRTVLKTLDYLLSLKTHCCSIIRRFSRHSLPDH
jgi:hypothetical protein